MMKGRYSARTHVDYLACRSWPIEARERRLIVGLPSATIVSRLASMF